MFGDLHCAVCQRQLSFLLIHSGMSLAVIGCSCAGASSGIGREVALECARRGARLLLGCRNANKAEAVVAYIKRKTGNDDIHYVVVDLACLTSVRQLVEVCCRRQWTVDVLINNAGPSGFSLQLLFYVYNRPGGNFGYLSE